MQDNAGKKIEKQDNAGHARHCGHHVFIYKLLRVQKMCCAASPS